MLQKRWQHNFIDLHQKSHPVTGINGWFSRLLFIGLELWEEPNVEKCVWSAPSPDAERCRVACWAHTHTPLRGWSCSRIQKSLWCFALLTTSSLDSNSLKKMASSWFGIWFWDQIFSTHSIETLVVWLENGSFCSADFVAQLGPAECGLGDPGVASSWAEPDDRLSGETFTDGHAWWWRAEVQ